MVQWCMVATLILKCGNSSQNCLSPSITTKTVNCSTPPIQSLLQFSLSLVSDKEPSQSMLILGKPKISKKISSVSSKTMLFPPAGSWGKFLKRRPHGLQPLKDSKLKEYLHPFTTLLQDWDPMREWWLSETQKELTLSTNSVMKSGL